MKLNRLLIASLLGFSLLTNSALASDNHSNGGSGEESHWSMLGWFHHVADSHRECDHNGQNTGTGRNCAHGVGNGGGYCSTGGGNTSGGGGKGSDSGGTTTGTK